MDSVLSRRIIKLDESVINRIAAGEVIQRPANVVKELLENSLDAGSTSIAVTMSGLKLIQIQDNGHGIRRDDMPIVCERFTTSKLKTFEDLTSIGTFGFRGEALASVSHVARVSITTKTSSDDCAIRAAYLDGVMLTNNPAPKLCAGNIGTTICVEDLFYNLPTRRSALSNTAEEYRRVCDVVSRYAVHAVHAGITLRHGDEAAGAGATSAVDVRTAGGSNANRIDAIRAVFGADIAKSLIPVNLDENSNLGLRSGQCLVSGPSYTTGRKFTLLLFVNGRLVESPSLSRVIESTYAVFLPKKACPFVYVALEIRSSNLDVNVHPTKQQVHFLFETEIIELVKSSIESLLVNQNISRTFQVFTASATLTNPVSLGASAQMQQKLPSVSTGSAPPRISAQTAVAPAKMVRVDAAQPKLIEFFHPVQSKQQSSNPPRSTSVLSVNRSILDDVQPLVPVSSAQAVLVDSASNSMDQWDSNAVVSVGSVVKAAPSSTAEKAQKQQRPDVICVDNDQDSVAELASVAKLLEETKSSSHDGLKRIFEGFSFVGCVDASRSLIQHETALLMINNAAVMTDFFYQLILVRLGRLPCCKFDTPQPLAHLATIALDTPSLSGWTESDGPKEQLANFCKNLLVSKASLLLDYFAIQIDTASGSLTGTPQLLPGLPLDQSRLASFVLRLGSVVDWDHEKSCIEGVARELARLYAIRAAAPHETQVEPEPTKLRSVVETIVFSAIRHSRSWYHPDRKLAESGVVLQLTTVPELYKFFERC